MSRNKGTNKRRKINQKNPTKGQMMLLQDFSGHTHGDLMWKKNCYITTFTREVSRSRTNNIPQQFPVFLSIKVWTENKRENESDLWLTDAEEKLWERALPFCKHWATSSQQIMQSAWKINNNLNSSASLVSTLPRNREREKKNGGSVQVKLPQNTRTRTQ